MKSQIHQGQPASTSGADRDMARLAVILLHGRGATASSMIPLAEELKVEGVHFIMPQAAQNRWYPQSAFGPIEANEPDLSSALELVGSLVEELEADGYTYKQVVVGGFSQGACLASEYIARNARRYGGLFVLSGALIGPPGTARDYPGSLDRMPVFIGGSDVDPWIPDDLQRETAQVLEQLGANVEIQIYDGMPHTVNQDEVERVHALLTRAREAQR